MALGGFSGTDNSITLAAFEKLVAAGEIHYFIGGGNSGGPGGGSNANSRDQQLGRGALQLDHGRRQTVYDLTKATS